MKFTVHSVQDLRPTQEAGAGAIELSLCMQDHQVVSLLAQLAETYSKEELEELTQRAGWNDQ